nr:MAG TPA: hypothetical protein [Caudoviricetes sp.]
MVLVVGVHYRSLRTTNNLTYRNQVMNAHN